MLRHKLPEILPSVTYPATDICSNFFVAAIVAKSRSQFYFPQRVSQRSVARNFSHVAQCNTFLATCVATLSGIGQSNCSFCAREVLFQDKMAAELTSASKMTETLPSVTRFKQPVSQHTTFVTTKFSNSAVAREIYGGPQVQRRNKKSRQNKFQLTAQQNKFAVKRNVTAK